MNRTVFLRVQNGLWLLPVLLASLVNLNVLANGFGWDDDTIIQTLRPPDSWRSLLLPDLTPGPATKQDAPYYRPVVALSYLFDYSLWGNRPFGFHLSVVLAHLLNTALVFFLARGLQRAQCIAPLQTHTSQPTTQNFLPLLAASLFAVHPAHAEAVAWIAGRNDVFCASFLLLSFLLYTRSHPTKAGRSTPRLFFAASMAAFALALLTKEAAVGLILLFPLYDALTAPLTGRPQTSIRLARRIAVRLLIPLTILGFYWWMRNQKIEFHYDAAAQPTFLSHLTVSKISDALGAIGLYLKLLVIPYPHNPFIAEVPASTPVLILAVLAGGGLLAGLIWTFTRREIVFVIGLAWTLVLLAPAISIAVFDFAATPAAERYIYAPSAGFLIVIAGLILKLLDRLPADGGPFHKVGIVAGLFILSIILAWGWTSWNRNAVWRNPMTFWQKAVAGSPNVGYPYRQLGREYAQLKQDAEAQRLYQQAVTIDEKAQLPKHQSTAKSLNVLAEFYYARGRYAEAEPLYQRVLAIREKVLRPDHPDLANSLNSLASLYQAQGRYAEAEPLFKRSIAVREKAAGPDHPFVAIGLNSLAGLYYAQGRYAEAEPLYQRSLAIREKTFGPDHPDVAAALNNLASLYYAQKKYAEAAPLYQRSLAIREKTVGPEHPFVAVGLNNLAGLYYIEGKYAQAEPLYLQAIAIDEKIRGPEHPDVATGLNNLAGLYFAQGKYAQAEPLYKRALAIREKTLGPNHPDRAASLENYAVLLRKLKRDAEAAQLEARAKAIRNKHAQ